MGLEVNVNVMRKNILFELESFEPNLARIVRGKRCLVSAIIVPDKECAKGKSLVFYDFTCGKDAHQGNLLRYSVSLYDWFENSSHPSLSV